MISQGDTMKTTIYVDMDGTLLHGELDRLYTASGYDIHWYDQQYIDHLAINYKLVRVLKKLKRRGHRLVLWTNRGTIQIEMTRANLGELWHLFDDHQFHGGKKRGTNVGGYTIDNEVKYNPTILIGDF
jgi:histidinol phosphatase-like enzyme